MMTKPFYWGLASLLIAFGCSTPKAAYDKTFEPYVDPVHGSVVRVNTEDGYVVLECTVLPIAGEQITLYRNKQIVARLKTARLRDRHFVIADILEGAPMPGDWFRGSTGGVTPQQRQ